MTSVIRSAIVGTCMLATAASALAAQQAGSITGHVTEKGSGAPIPNAQIDALGAGRGSGVAGSDGRFTISNLPAGTYVVTARRVGRAPGRAENIAVRAGAATTVDFTLSTATELEQVVVTASRQAEKVVDAPASISVVPADVVAARPALTKTDNNRTIPRHDL